jgi:hypothetical protein
MELSYKASTGFAWLLKPRFYEMFEPELVSFSEQFLQVHFANIHEICLALQLSSGVALTVALGSRPELQDGEMLHLCPRVEESDEDQFEF